MGGLDQGDRSGDEGGRGAGAPALVVLVVGVRDDDVDAGGADRGVPAAGGEGGAGAELVDGGRGDDARIGGRVRDAVAPLAAVAGRGDHDGALLQGVLDGLVLTGFGVGGLGVVAEGEVDDVGAVVGGPADALGEGVSPGTAGLGAGGIAVLQDDADGEDPGLGGDAHDTVAVVGAVSVPGDDACHRGAVPGPGAVAAAGSEADHVLAFEDVADEVRVVVLDAGVEDGDGDARALGGLPGLLGVHGVQGPLLGANGVSVRGGGRQDGQAGAEQDGERAGPPGPEGGHEGLHSTGHGAGRRAVRSGVATGVHVGAHVPVHDDCSVDGPTCLRRARSTRSARRCASWPRPAWATAVVSPDRIASSAGSGSSTVRPSAQPETA